MVVAAIEAYHDECLGLLLGYKTAGKTIVEDCIVYQSAKRKPTEVEAVWNRENKVVEVIPKLTQMQPLGYFHSHTKWGRRRGRVELSQTDRDSIREDEVEVIVAINECKRSAKLRQTRLGFSVTVGQYHISIAAFHRGEKITQCKLLCPYALGFCHTFSETQKTAQQPAKRRLPRG
jgi:proteasome lid subunit RPN8/RPN11